jgi:outer membrane protein OmpA-like peptidoglycan-associated protein
MSLKIAPLAAFAAPIVALAVAGCAQTSETLKHAGLTRPAQACVDTDLTVYFEEGADQLTAPGQRLVGTTARRLKRCDVLRARVVGLADAPGAPADNLTLSQRRSQRVVEALAAAGLPAPTFELAAEGEAGALTPDGREAPLRRRAEVHLTVRPRPAG